MRQRPGKGAVPHRQPWMLLTDGCASMFGRGPKSGMGGELLWQIGTWRISWKPQRGPEYRSVYVPIEAAEMTRFEDF